MHGESEYASYLAETCKTIINDPENNIERISEFIKRTDNLTLLCLLKVFKNIVPLYKIKIIEDQVKHNKEFIKLQNFDKALYNYYKIFIGNLSKSSDRISFYIAVDLLENLDHFNFTEKILNKVLRGTKNTNPNIQKRCVDAIVSKVATDTIGDITFKVILELLTFDFCDDLYRSITNVNIISEIESDYYKDETKTGLENNFKNKSENKKSNQNTTVDKKDLKKMKLAARNKHKSISRGDKKMNFEMAKIGKLIDYKENKEKVDGYKKTLRKIVDNIMRICFIILKEEKKNLYVYAFISLNNYKRFIKNDFYEGLTIMLENCMAINDYRISLYATSCYIGLFGNRNYEFKPVLNALFKILHPLKNDFDQIDLDLMINLLEKMLIHRKETKSNVEAFLHRLMQFSALNYSNQIILLIQKIIIKYNVDTKDFEYVKNGLYSALDDDLQKIPFHPFYENQILNKFP